MVVKHRKKSGRSLGNTYRSGKRRRGAGNRGGVGKAGHGKRSKQKKMSFFVKGEGFGYGQRGFTSKQKKTLEVTIGYICEHADSLCEKKEGKYIASVEKLGYDKVLGSGVVNKPLIVKDFGAITPKAKDKVKKAGGDVIEQ